MSSVRVKGAGWSSNEKFTSAQATQLDINAANSLDKTVAGDTLFGFIGMQSTAQIAVDTPGANITASVASGISGTAVASIVSTTPGAIALAGGPTDYPAFQNGAGLSVPRSFNRYAPLSILALMSPWTVSQTTVPVLVGTGATTPQILLLPSLWNGATLASVACTIIVGSHSAVPVNLPTISVSRRSLTTATATLVKLASSDPQAYTPTPGSGSAWFASGNDQFLVYACNQNNVIDTSKYEYFVTLVDENGTGSNATNNYVGLILSYTNVTDIRPQ